MTLSRILAAAAVLLVLGAGRADAQQADTLAVSTALWTACPGAYVRLDLRAGDTVEGRCGSLSDNRLQVRFEGEDREIRLAEVDSVWTRKSYVTEATVVLAVLGAATGVLAGGEMERCGGIGCTTEYGFGRAGRAGIGAVAGAAVGVLAGSRFTTWRRRFP
jgi:hypothetical protein